MSAVSDRRDYEYLLQRIEGLKTLIRRVSGATGGGGSAITALTGDVTATGPGAAAATIPNNTITNGKLADMAAATVKGRAAGAGTGDPQDLTADQLIAILDTATVPLATASWVPLALGSEPLTFVSDGAGEPILVAYAP